LLLSCSKNHSHTLHGRTIFIKASKLYLNMRDSLLEELDRWRNKIVGNEFDKDLVNGSKSNLTANIAKFFNQLLLKLKLEYTNRTKIRQKIEMRSSEIIELTNMIIAEVKLMSNKEVLVVIDDLDKLDLNIAEDIFYRRQITLTQPSCNIIYIMPLALHYSSNFGQINQAFTNSYVLPNIAIKHKDHSPNIEGINLMKEFVAKRMSLDLIDEDALEHAITISGGLFREMVNIINTAADESISRDDEKIRLDDVKGAESEIRNEFRRMLRSKDYDALKKIHESCDIEDAETCSELMHNLSVLEYRNDENWYDVHPAIVPLLEK